MLLAMESPWYISESEILIRLVIALVLGGIVGFEREQHRHAAGFRTNILVCVGACLMMLLSIYGFSDFVNEWNVRVDPARLAAAVITGVGFLGAGTILFTGKKNIWTDYGSLALGCRGSRFGGRRRLLLCFDRGYSDGYFNALAV